MQSVIKKKVAKFKKLDTGPFTYMKVAKLS